MRLLFPGEVQGGDIARKYGHSPIPALIMGAWFIAPALAVVWNWGSVWSVARELPWPAWLVVAPVAVIVIAITWLCLSATRSVIVASFLPSNWLVKATREGVYLHLRSYQNHHFADDEPTVAFLSFDEIASVRRVDESFESGLDRDRARGRKSWIEFQLKGVDTSSLASWLAGERARPGPTTRTLGVRSSTRFNHSPVIVPRPGCIYVEWLGRKMLRELAEQVATEERKVVALDAPNTRSLETRLGELIARGEPIVAVALAREERKLSLTQAHSLVESVRRATASGAER